MGEATGVGERVRQILAGDRKAAAWLYDTFAPELFRRLSRRYPHLSVHEVEDTLHDAFVLLFSPANRTLRSFLDGPQSDEAELGRRLWGLACGLVTNRRRAGRGVSEVALGDHEFGSGEPSSERVVLHRDLLARLDDCLASRRERIALYLSLRHRDGLSPEEIMHVTGWSPKITYKLKAALDEALRECAKWLGIALR